MTEMCLDWQQTLNSVKLFCLLMVYQAACKQDFYLFMCHHCLAVIGHCFGVFLIGTLCFRRH